MINTIKTVLNNLEITQQLFCSGKVNLLLGILEMKVKIRPERMVLVEYS